MTTSDATVFRVTDLCVSLHDVDVAARKMHNVSHDERDVLSPLWRPAIRGVSFEVNRGEILSIVGESASGKTLSMYAAFRLLDPGAQATSGTVELFGQRVDAARGGEVVRKSGQRRRRGAPTGDDEWRQTIGSRVGFLFQDPIGSWTPHFTIGYQAGEALDEHTDLTTDEIERRVRDALGEVKLSRRGFGVFAFLLSRGEAQRAMLAAAIVKVPDLLIADEPLTGLDSTSAASVLALLRDMQDKRGMAMVFITHDLALAASFSDRIAIMYAGRLVETAPTQELMRRPRHPYTEGLIGALPMVGRDRLRPVRGSPPHLWHTVQGCGFAPRCDFATEVCAQVPPSVGVGEEASVACWLQDQLSLQGILAGR